MKPIEEKRSEPITVWVRPEMKTDILAVSEKTGLPVAVLVRGLLTLITGMKPNEAD